jgi:DNA-binding MarR family transcriptional regulator
VAEWTFLTNHAHVLVCLSDDESLRVRDIAERIGITERAVVRILGELVDAEYVEKFRDGRRNHYRILRDQPLRHPLESRHTVGDLLDSVAD